MTAPTEGAADPRDEREDPADRFLHAWRRPPGRIFLGCTLATALATLAAESTPGFSDLWFAAFAGWWFLALVWLARVVIYGVALVAGRAERRPAHFLIGPALLTLTYAVVATDAPLHARWALSRSAFQDYVEHPETRPFPIGDHSYDVAPPGSRLGLFPVTKVWQDEDATYVVVGSALLGGDVGFAHVDPTRPGQPAERRSSPELGTALGDGWYVYTSAAD